MAFEEAQTVFADDDAILLADPAHSESEDRFDLLGLSSRWRVLVVIRRVIRTISPSSSQDFCSTASAPVSGSSTIRATRIGCIATRPGSFPPPDVGEPSQGWYASGETGHAHWMYFLLD
ncbi:MAG: BrnT family toxin [Vicinamibacterales bacterium]